MEYDAEQRCFILKDLNSSTGTYLHDSRLQQTPVQVTDGDRVRFGSHGLSLELRLEQRQEVFGTLHAREKAKRSLPIVAHHNTIGLSEIIGVELS